MKTFRCINCGKQCTGHGIKVPMPFGDVLMCQPCEDAGNAMARMLEGPGIPLEIFNPKTNTVVREVLRSKAMK